MRARDEKPLPVRAGRRTLPVTHPSRIVFEDDGITKAEIAEHYAAVAARMLPHVRGRPLTMERMPERGEARRIYQKNMPRHFPDWIPRATLPKEGGTVTYVLAEGADVLVYLAGQGMITAHTWLSRADRPQHPDLLVMDLDPAGDEFAVACRAAGAVKSLFEDVGLVPFVQTTGSSGLHVIAPLDRRAPYDEANDFGHLAAAIIAARYPDDFTTEFRIAARRGRLFLDATRNKYSQTAVSPYAVRTRPGAPVATPLHWDELTPRMSARAFTVRSIRRRLDDEDPWRAMHAHRRSLARARRALDEIARAELRRAG